MIASILRNEFLQNCLNYHRLNWLNTLLHCWFKMIYNDSILNDLKLDKRKHLTICIYNFMRCIVSIIFNSFNQTIQWKWNGQMWRRTRWCDSHAFTFVSDTFGIVKPVRPRQSCPLRVNMINDVLIPNWARWFRVCQVIHNKRIFQTNCFIISFVCHKNAFLSAFYMSHIETFEYVQILRWIRKHYW